MKGLPGDSKAQTVPTRNISDNIRQKDIHIVKQEVSLI